MNGATLPLTHQRAAGIRPSTAPNEKNAANRRNPAMGWNKLFLAGDGPAETAGSALFRKAAVFNDR